MLTDADEGEDNLNGIRIAVNEANREGGVGGRRVELKIRRDSGRGELAVRIAQQFVADERIVREPLNRCAARGDVKTASLARKTGARPGA